MGVSGNSVAGKSFQIFTVSEELLAKVTEAVQAGEKEARSSGNIQSFEVFCHGFRANISLGRLMVIPPAVCNDRENFPTALLHGALVRVFGTGGEEIADLVEKKIGESEFDEYSQADFDSLKESLFIDKKTGKEACLIVFAPNWMNSREYICFHFTKDAGELSNNLRHQVFSAYYNPAVSSAFNALMTNVDTTKVDVTDITPKLSYPFLTENPLKEFPRLDKQATHKKATILLNKKTADDVTKQTLEPQELDVFEALDTALSNSLLPNADGAQGEGGFTAPEAKPGVPREAAAKKEYEKCEKCGKQAEISKEFIAGQPLKKVNCKHCGNKKTKAGSKTADVNPVAPHEAPFTNVGPGTGAEDAQESTSKAVKESDTDAAKQNEEKATSPIGIAIDENGVPRRKEEEKKAGKKVSHLGKDGICPGCKKAGNKCSCSGCTCKAASNPASNRQESSHPETLRVGQDRLSSAYSAAYNGGFVDKHAMPPQAVRNAMAEVGDNSKPAPHAAHDHAKQIEAGVYGEDPLNRRANEKWGSAKVSPKTAKRKHASFPTGDEFTDSYIETALWASNDNSTPNGGDPLDKNYGYEDIAPQTLKQMQADCVKFQKENAALLKQAYASGTRDGNPEHAGHDFWLTRNGHGAGFWDSDYPKPLGEQLTKASKAYGEADLYIGDDEKIWQYGIPTSGSVASINANYIASKMGKIVDSDGGYEAMSSAAKKARTKKESLLNKFRPKTADVALDIDDIWDAITEDMGPAPLVEVEGEDEMGNPAPSNTEDQGGWNETTGEGEETPEAPAPSTAPRKRDVQDLPEAFRSDKPEEEKEVSDSEAEQEETGFENNVTEEEEEVDPKHEGSWRIDAKLADFVEDVANEIESEEEFSPRLKCDQCNMMSIQGVPVHEGGCPNDGARWDAENGNWVKQRECFDCGSEVDYDDPCCQAEEFQDRMDEEVEPHMASAKTATSEELKKKLFPGRFKDISGKMAAIVGYILDEAYTQPSITEMAITSDGFVMAQQDGDVGMNDIIGSVDDLKRNWENLCSAAGLKPKEKQEADSLFKSRIRSYQHEASAKAAANRAEVEAQADKLMLLENEVWDSLGIQSGGELRQNPDMSARYNAAMIAALKNAGIRRVSKAVLDALTNENYHTLVALIQSKATKAKGATQKNADTADNDVDVDSAANPTSKETGSSATVEAHEEYNTERSEGTDRPKTGANWISPNPDPFGKDWVGADKLNEQDAKQNDPYARETDLNVGKNSHWLSDEDPFNKEWVGADAINEQDSKDSDPYARETDLNVGKSSHWLSPDADPFKDDWVGADKLNEQDSKKHDPYARETDLNVDKNSAWLSDEDPFNKDWVDADKLNEQDAKKSDPFDRGTEMNVDRKRSADVSGDFAEAKSETVSPDTVDNDIQQPTVSVDEAGVKNGSQHVAMRFMNRYDIEDAVALLGNDPVLGKAARFLRDFMEEVDSHSDGWAYWRPPVQAADKLMQIVTQGVAQRRGYGASNTGIDLSDAGIRKAMGPIKSFMTRRGLAAGMEMPKLAGQDVLAADISGDMSEAKSELDYNKAEIADDSAATDTVNPDHFACRHDDVPVAQGEAADEKQPKSDLNGVAPEAHDVPPQVDSKAAAAGDDQPESVEFDFGAGDLADIVMAEDNDEPKTAAGKTAYPRKKKMPTKAERETGLAAMRLEHEAQRQNAVGIAWTNDGLVGVHLADESHPKAQVMALVKEAIANGYNPQPMNIGQNDAPYTQCLICNEQLAELDDNE